MPEPVAPVEAQPDPVVPEQPAPVEAPIPGRSGGLGAQHINRASKLEDVILVDDNRARNADRATAKLAAQ